MNYKKLLIISGIIAAMAISVNGAEKKKKKSKDETPTETVFQLKTADDSLAYCLGLSIASNLKNAFDSVKVEAMAKGISDVYYDSAIITPAEADKFIRAYIEDLQSREGKENLAKGKKFLEENAKREGVKTTETGLQYEVLEEGDGPTPGSTDKVKVHYEGTLIDGKVFDSSYERGQPAQFGVNQVISGWTEALQLMNVGSKYKLYIPANLAYGERGNSAIGPNQVLIFTVELLDIVK